MPRTVSRALRRMYERSNPNVRYAVEMHRPDVSAVFRRIDQFTGPAKLSEVPAATLEADPSGGLTLVRAPSTIADFHVDDSSVGLLRPDATRHLRGLMWTMDGAFPAAVAKTVATRLHRNTTRPLTVALQIYRMGQTSPSSGATATTFIPLLQNPPTIKTSAVGFDAFDNATFTFDLTAYALDLRRAGVDGVGANGFDLIGQEIRYFFVIDVIDGSADNQLEWIRDATTGRTIGGIGEFRDATWANATPGTATGWGEGLFNQCPWFQLAVEAPVATSKAVYQIDLGAIPAASSVGRIVFEPGAPIGTSAALELSTSGVGGPWVLVNHGDLVAPSQQVYHLRLTLNRDAAQRQAPHVSAIGIEFRNPIDVSLEAVVDPVEQAISVPFCEAMIGQGTVSIVRTGRRDFNDPGTAVAIAGAASAIEAEIMLASDHPDAVRSEWLTVTRAPASDRLPSATSERFTLLSVLKQLQAKIPARVETVNLVAKVVAASTASIALENVDGSPIALPGLPYTGLNYYLRVRESSAAGIETGYIQTIETSTAPNLLGFVLVHLPGTLNAGDIVEIHSGLTAQPVLQWVDQDPADIWWELLTVQRSIPPDRIGRADLGIAGRSGLPPRVTDRAPGDLVTQAKLKVTRQLQDIANCDKLIDQLSFIMGGATVEVAGQIVFRQIYPTRKITGEIVIPAAPTAAIFDELTTIKLQTPTGVEQRMTSMACNYGVDTTVEKDDTAATETTEFADVDALAFLSEQDLHDLVQTTIPDEIAAWCFNSADGGLLLASLLCQQVVLVASTGLRVWAWGSTEQRPELVVGDRVTVITDQYTDIDPSRNIQIRGRWAYSLVLTDVAACGRQFKGLVMGLSDAVNVRGGAGDLTAGAGIGDATAVALNNFKWTDSADGLTRTFTMIAGALVHRVAVFVNTVAVPPLTDPWPGDGALPTTILTPDPVTGLVAVQITKPTAQNQTFVQFEPRMSDWTEGPVRRAVVDASPAALAGTLHGIVTNGTADLKVNVQAGVADWPVTVDVLADDPFGAVLVTTSVAANVTLDKTSPGMAALGGVLLPLRGVRRFWLRLTNVAGEVWLSDPISIDRDSVPYGYVTVDDYEYTPVIKVSYDDDTDTIVIGIQGGIHTKTYAGLVGAGEVAYIAGFTVYDGGGVENAFAPNEQRATYDVTITGGGVSTKIWGNITSGSSGALHGPIYSAIAQGNVIITSNGQPSWSADGPAQTDHFKYAESNSAFPSDATALAGTTLTGRHVTRTGGAALSFGLALYVTAIAVDAQGNALQSIHLFGAYQTYTATRTTNYGIGSFVELNFPAGGASGSGFNIAGSLQPNGNGAIDPQQDFYCIVVISDGSTLTDVFADVYSENNGSSGGSAQGHNTSVRFDRVSTTGAVTNLGNHAAADNGGWQTLHMTMSEATAGNRYTFHFITSQGSAPSTPSHTRIADFYTVTTIPNPAVGVG